MGAGYANKPPEEYPPPAAIGQNRISSNGLIVSGGWAMMPRMTQELVCRALRMVIATRLPLAKPLLHSDRGSQYAGQKHQQILAAFGRTCSMSRKANCWDNAVIESFFATLKTESSYQQRFGLPPI